MIELVAQRMEGEDLTPEIYPTKTLAEAYALIEPVCDSIQMGLIPPGVDAFAATAWISAKYAIDEEMKRRGGNA